ncbi:MAG TPA: non-homologous end-joining DNA ligase [Alphaproteobacteria bacterium]
MSEAIDIEGVRITNPDRVLYPEMGLTKRDLIDYYGAVAEQMMPHLADRPVSLVRCPQGRQRQCFFQKHATDGMPAAFAVAAIREASGELSDYLAIDSFEGVIAGVQVGTLEFHIWGSRRKAIEKPDRLVFDLDPDPALNFAAVRQAAVEMRDFLADLGIESFALVTGGKGIHVVAPLAARREWPDVKRFAHGVAVTLAERAPERYVATASKARRRGRIFIDYLRNERGATAIAPYSTRARAGAPVATPVSWDELEHIERANAFSTDAVRDRIRRQKRDPWDGYDAVLQSLTERMLKRMERDRAAGA